MEMKAKFEAPEVKILAFLPVDVITLSAWDGDSDKDFGDLFG